MKKWFGDTVHIRELNVGDYPYQQLINLFVDMKYDVRMLLEARTSPDDGFIAMKEQVNVFNAMIASAKNGRYLLGAIQSSSF